MTIHDLPSLLRACSYAGRGIVTGCTPDGKTAATAYFIMGRSVNSRNRIFVRTEDGIVTRAFDEALVKDPSLIIYAPVRRCGDRLIVTNGDQTDTIYEALAAGSTMEAALETRCFEPDAPHFTPRISSVMTLREGSAFRYEMSILKAADDAGTACCRFYFRYPMLPGRGHFLHTYQGDGNPLPSFSGEPECVSIPASIDEWTASLWESLHPDNKISLYVRYDCLSDGSSEIRLLNKNV